MMRHSLTISRTTVRLSVLWFCVYLLAACSPPMPDLDLGAKETEALAQYIMSLAGTE